MSEYVVKMPDVGEGIAEAEIVEWHVNVGDTIAEDQVMVEVMTDKATVELPSPVSGIVTSVGAAVGEILQVGSPLIRIDTGNGVATEVPSAVEPAAQPAEALPAPVAMTPELSEDVPEAPAPETPAIDAPVTESTVDGALAGPGKQQVGSFSTIGAGTSSIHASPGAGAEQ